MASNQQVSSSRSEDIPVFAGDETLAFGVANMPPNIRVYAYVNNENITPFTAPINVGATIGDPIFTDQLGAANGYLYIPSTEGKYRFLTGEIRITFTDSPNGIQNSRFISETTLFNHGLSLVDIEQGTTVSLRATEKFRVDSTGSLSGQNPTQKRLDPLAQTFFVDETKYPLGIVLTGVNLFIYEKDDSLPLAIELRPMEGGVPSTSEYFAGSFVVLNPNSVNAFLPSEVANATVFTFQHPIFLRPGEYALCVLSKSNKYKLLTARAGDGRTVKVPFSGKLFKPQNTGNWVGTSNEDLTFVFRKAKFETGTIVFELETPKLSALEYNRMRLLTTEINFGDVAYVGYRIQTTNAGSETKNPFKELLPNSEPNIVARQVANSKGDIKVEVSVTTKNQDISPILDRQLLKAQVFKHNVVPYSTAISDSELSATHGQARSRYLSKVVTLQEGFDSAGMQVQLDVNRKTGTDVEIFVRVLSRKDRTLANGIGDRPFVRLSLVDPSVKTFAGADDDLFFTEIYRLLEPNFSYTNPVTSTGLAQTTSSFDDFAYYQIKVIFYAGNPTLLPKIKNLVATSLL